MWLTRLALRNPIFILMMSLMVCVLGYVSFTRLSVDLFPEISMPLVRVATFYAGAGPGDIEKSITEPIERSVSATPGVDRIESFSKQGVSVVSVYFNYGTNLDNAQFEVQQRVSQVMNQLPPGIQQPFIIKFDISNMPVATVTVNAEGLDERQLYDIALNTIEPQIERLPGVASAAVGGGRVRQILVKVDPDALRARNLAILDVVNSVKTSNLLLPSGNLRAGERDYNVFSNTQIEDPREIRDVVLRTANPTGTSGTQPVRVSDIAEIEDGVADQTEVVRINGQRAVTLRVQKQPGANTIGVVDALQKALPEMRGLPPNVKLALSFDQSRYIRAAVGSLQHEAVFGGALAVVVILFFLANLRATGIVAVAIPLSIIATFMLLYFTRQTLNIFTLGGLALGVGRLVDDSIVELENIHRHLDTETDRTKAVLAAAQEVAMPIFVSTVTTIVVFLPVLFLSGVALNLFLPLAMTIAFSLIMSFFVSRTVTPLMCLYTLKSGAGVRKNAVARTIEAGLNRLDNAYARSLGWVLGHRLITVVAILGLFVASLGLMRKLPTEFFPETDEAQFQINFRTPLGTRVEKTEQVAIRIESIVAKALTVPGRDKPIFNTIYSSAGLPAGRGGLFSGNTGPHAGSVSVNLVPRAQRPMSDIQAAELVRKELRDAFPGTQTFFFTGGIVKRILNFGSSAPIDVEILGYDLKQGGELAAMIAAKLRVLNDADGKPLLTDVQISREEDYPQLDVDVDRQKAGVLGLNEQQIAQSVLASLVGSSQFSPIPYTDPKTGNEYNINVRLEDRARAEVGHIGDIGLRSPSGAIVSLDSVAEVRRGSGPVQVTRKYMQRLIDVTANVAPGKDLGTASNAVQKVVDDIPKPEGFTVGLGGQSAAQKQAFSGLGLAALMALVLVYMVLASQFRSLLDPLVIMISVPLGVTGVFTMLYVTGTSLSVNSFMGIIMMVGIVVSNGVLLVDFANQLRGRGLPIKEATIEAGRTRLRPILMTTIATLVGLAPMAMGIGEGSETNLPLARAVIGGLAVSTVFTLFLVPALYTAIERFSRRRDFHGEGSPGAEAANG